MKKPIDALPDLELLGVLIGYKSAETAFQAAGGSLATLLNESLPLEDVSKRGVNTV